MPCTPVTQTCTPIPTSILKLAGLGHNSRCLIPIQPGPPGTTLVVGPDQQSFCWLPMHHPARLTSNKAPFEWSDANQCGNIPLMSVTQNADGSVTIDPGDGNPAVTIPNRACILGDCQSINQPFNCKSTLTANPDGSYTFTNPDGSTITFTPGGPGGTNHPPLTLTRAQDLTAPDPRATLNAATQVLNLPPAILAHRRYDQPTQGKIAVPGNTWAPIPFTATVPTTNIVRDTTGGAMTPATGGIVIPRTGYYQIEGSTIFDLIVIPYSHAVAILRNGTILHRGYAAFLTGQPQQPTVQFSYPFTAGDIVGLAAYSANPTGNLHASADLVVRWLAD